MTKVKAMQSFSDSKLGFVEIGAVVEVEDAETMKRVSPLVEVVEEEKPKAGKQTPRSRAKKSS